MLSKSKFTNYVQCPKKMWLNVFKPELGEELNQAILENGNMVGKLAQGLFPNGVLINIDRSDKNNLSNMLSKTNEHIQSGTNVLYEAAFSKDGLLAICDILVKVHGGYDVYEVKSSTELKEINLYDLSFQKYVLQKCGLNIRDVYVVYLNNQYVRGKELELEKLFIKHNVTIEAQSLQAEIENMSIQAIAMLSDENEPMVDIGVHCDDPYACQFKCYCYKDIPKNSVFDIAGMRKSTKFKHYYRGYITFWDLKENGVAFNENQKMQVESELFNKTTIDKPKIKDFLDTLYYPLYFLDFETFSPPVPLFEDTRPYEKIPFQYSLHYIETKGGEVKHKEFLAKEGTDPREDLIKQLIYDIPMNACVLAYNMSFERSVIKTLFEKYDEYFEALYQIYNNILDLMVPFQKRLFYTKEMQGSYSIKYVLPALFPNDKELSYKNLEFIHNGDEAMNTFLYLDTFPIDERKKLREALLAYCKLDTLAMVKIWEKLKKVVEN